MNEIRLSKAFYRFDAIDITVKAYQEIATIRVKETMEYFICEIIESQLDYERVLKEFENYALAQMNQ